MRSHIFWFHGVIVFAIKRYFAEGFLKSDFQRALNTRLHIHGNPKAAKMRSMCGHRGVPGNIRLSKIGWMPVFGNP